MATKTHIADRAREQWHETSRLLTMTGGLYGFVAQQWEALDEKERGCFNGQRELRAMVLHRIDQSTTP